ncbi:MAG TPA: sigma-70 family RNA polymerase sigma factor [Caulobacteraceae bacterium]|nr:sigma-70 family RNA polymerase sigma factor [Caulobacteraceae bacterium]
MTGPEISDEVRDAARSAWWRYLDLLTPFRPELHRYCRRLTGDVWDAEDLVQETLLKGFASLGSVNVTIANPRGYLVRIASNLWIDGQRRRTSETAALAMLDDSGVATQPDRASVRDAGARLFERLSPQERAAVVLKDVFDLTLAEIAASLSTSVGAVKAALHHGRGRLHDDTPVRSRVASAVLVDEFVERLDAGDLAGLLSLMLDTGAVEMPGALIEVGRREFERKGSWLWQAVNVHPDLPPDARPPKWSNRRVMFQGEPIVLGLAPALDGPRLQGITRFEEEDGKIARIRSYCFNPEAAAEVAQAFGLETGWIPYRFPTPA